MEWEGIFANHVFDKGSISKIYHNQKNKLINNKSNNRNKKWTKNLNRCFLKEDMQMTSQYMQKISTLLMISEMQIKTAMRYHLIPGSMSIIKQTNKKKTGSVDKNVEKLESC